MICVQKVKGENRSRAENGGRVPRDAQELLIFFEVLILGTFAETNEDSVMPRKVDNEYLLGFWGDRAAIARMS